MYYVAMLPDVFVESHLHLKLFGGDASMASSIILVDKLDCKNRGIGMRGAGFFKAVLCLLC